MSFTSAFISRGVCELNSFANDDLNAHSVVVFGIITLGTAFIHNRGSFFAMRSLLGVAESLVFPGNAYMLTRVSVYSPAVLRGRLEFSQRP